MKLKNAWFVAEILGALGVVQRYKKNTAEWMRIQTATAWLKGIGFARDLVIYQVGISACVLLLVVSAILMEVAVIFCIPMSMQARATAVLVVSAIDFAVALSFLGFFLSSERWLKQAAKYNTCVSELLKNKKI